MRDNNCQNQTFTTLTTVENPGALNCLASREQSEVSVSESSSPARLARLFLVSHNLPPSSTGIYWLTIQLNLDLHFIVVCGNYLFCDSQDVYKGCSMVNIESLTKLVIPSGPPRLMAP